MAIQNWLLTKYIGANIKMLDDQNCEFGVKLVKINEIENVTYYMAEEVEYSEL